MHEKYQVVVQCHKEKKRNRKIRNTILNREELLFECNSKVEFFSQLL